MLTAEGRLYEVDLRLRPSGQKGPVATSLSAFDHYQHNEARIWEHLALTRARPLLGDRGYGGPEVAEAAPRQMLHAASVRFEEVAATSPDPPDFAALCARLRAG